MNAARCSLRLLTVLALPVCLSPGPGCDSTLQAMAGANEAPEASSAVRGRANEPDPLADPVSGSPSATSSVLTLPWIRSQEGRLVDATGREWLLRGINARVEGLFDVTFDDGRIALEPIPAFDASDAQQMAGLGFNYLRLPINWSGLEPQEGVFSESYLERLDEVVGMAEQAGLYILIDFHQDAWSKEIGEDGAPLWAITPPPKRLLEGPLDNLNQRRMSPQVLQASRSFFKNVDQLQDRFLPVWEQVIERFRDRPAVIGFELMNEPVAYYVACTPADLYGFYDKADTAMRQIDSQHTLWLEPDSSRNQLLRAPLRRSPFPDDNVVYEPHLYPPMSYDTEDAWKQGLKRTFDRMVAEADSWGAALVLGEWGTQPASTGSEAYIGAVTSLSDACTFGQTFWLWKEESQGYWGMFDYQADTDGWTLRSGPGVDALVRPGAMAVPGRLKAHVYNAAAETVTVLFEADGGEGAPLLYVPSRHYPNGAAVYLDGQVVSLTVDPATQRALVPWAGQAGAHELVITPR